MVGLPLHGALHRTSGRIPYLGSQSTPAAPSVACGISHGGHVYQRNDTRCDFGGRRIHIWHTAWSRVLLSCEARSWPESEGPASLVVLDDLEHIQRMFLK